MHQQYLRALLVVSSRRTVRRLTEPVCSDVRGGVMERVPFLVDCDYGGTGRGRRLARVLIAFKLVQYKRFIEMVLRAGDHCQHAFGFNAPLHCSSARVCRSYEIWEYCQSTGRVQP